MRGFSPLAPNPACVEHLFAVEPLAVDGLEDRVIDQQDDDVCTFQRGVQFGKGNAPHAFQFRRQGFNMRFDGEDYFYFGGSQMLHHVHRRALAQVVDVGFIGQAEAGDDRGAHGIRGVQDFSREVGRH